GDIRCVRTSAQVLHHQVDGAIVRKDTAHVDDRGLVLEHPQHFRLVFQRAYGDVEVVAVAEADADPPVAAASGDAGGEQLLDGDGLLGLAVPGPVADAETAMAFLAGEDITPADRRSLG